VLHKAIFCIENKGFKWDILNIYIINQMIGVHTMSYKRVEHYDRRRGPDLWVKLVHWLGITAWGIMFFIIFITDRARPPMETFFDRLFKVQVRQTWDLDLLQYALYLMITLCVLCIAGLLINTKRRRRKTDRYNISLILMMGLGIFSIIMYFANF
jgi:hypothetical protein